MKHVKVNEYNLSDRV